MAWTAPRTWVTGELVTAALMNSAVRDNLSFLAGTDANWVPTAESTSSASFTDLTTVGPVVSLTTGTQALVILSAEIQALGVIGFMGFAVSGATTLAPADSLSLSFGHHSTGGFTVQVGSSVYLSGLTPGVNTFTAKYRTTSGSPSFGNRRIAVIPLV